MVALLGVGLLDELASGVPTVSFVQIAESLHLGSAGLAGALLFVPGMLAMLVEPWLFVLADRHPRKAFVAGGLFAMGLGIAMAGLARSPWALMAAITLAWIGSGASVALGQATLADARPDDRERALTRWSVAGELGDLGAPLLLALCAATGLGWRSASAAVGASLVAWALWLATRRFPSRSATTETDEGTWKGLREALRHRGLMGWLAAAALCELLDEIVVVIASLHLRARGLSGVDSSLVIGAGVLGAIVGAAVTERLLGRARPMRLLLVSSIGCALAFAGWIVAPDGWSSGALFALVGATAAPMYPLVFARAYAALPERSGTVHAAAHAFTPLMLAIPLLLGWVADAWGTQWALLALLAQPIALALIAASQLRRPGAKH